jgi:hypothetical protein
MAALLEPLKGQAATADAPYRTDLTREQAPAHCVYPYVLR